MSESETTNLPIEPTEDRIGAVMKPVRVQRKRTKNWRMPENTIYVGRPTKYCNPWIVGKQGIETAQEAVDLYRYHLNNRNIFTELRGKNLSCWCSLDKPCHADVLLEMANK